MVTASTLKKVPLFDTPEKKEFLQDLLFRCVSEHSWDLDAWAILSNHYHLVLRSSNQPRKFRSLIRKFHSLSARWVNEFDRTPGRRVWFQYWDTLITYQGSYLARLAYVHANAVRHGLVMHPEDYPWCSAAWFLRHAPKELAEQVVRFHMDKMKIYDDF